MPGHDIIVIGSSAGGLKALTAIISRLPVEIDATLFVAQHIAPDHLSLLPQILSDTGELPAAHPSDGEPIAKGRIYVAPPNHHLLLDRGRVRVLRGPRENRFRPAIDTLFRSAARAYGPRVVGVVLTGFLDDGTVGLLAIKKRGGVAVVQDPGEAQYPDMPSNALRYVDVDHCLPLAQIPDLLLRLAAEPAAEEQDFGTPKDMEVESDIAEQNMESSQFVEGVEGIGTRSFYSCPACNGALWQVGESNEPLRFRCHVGHSFTAESVLAEQTRSLENTLWSALRLMEEKVMLARNMAQRRQSLSLAEAAVRYEEYADRLDREATMLRDLIESGFATRYLAEEGSQPENEASLRVAQTRSSGGKSVAR